MALNKQRIALPLSKGINQKIDPKQDTPGTLERLENVKISKYGEIEKKDGYIKIEDQYGYSSSGSDETYPIEDLKAITSLNCDLYLLTDNHAYTQSSGQGKAIFEGKYLPSSLKTHIIGQDTWNHQNVSSLVIGDHIYTVWDQRFGTNAYPHFNVRSLHDDTVLIPNKYIPAFNTSATIQYWKPKIAYFNGNIIFTCMKRVVATSVYSIAYYLAEPLNYETLTNSFDNDLITDVYSYGIYDINANANGNNFAIRWKLSGGAARLRIYNINAAGSLGVSYTSTSTASTCIAVDIAIAPTISYMRAVSDAVDTTDPGLDSYFITTLNGTNLTAVVVSGGENTQELYDSGTDLSSGTTFTSTTAVAATGVVRWNSWSDADASMSSLVFEQYIQFNLDGGSPTGDQIPYIDNKTGTRIYDTLVAADFGGSGYVKSGDASTPGFIDVALADIEPSYKTKIGRVRKFVTLSGGVYSTYSVQIEDPVIFGSSLLTKPYLKTGNPILPTGRTSTLQSSYYLINPSDMDSSTNRPVGLIGYGIADSNFEWGGSGKQNMASLSPIGMWGEKRIIPGLRKTRLKSNDKTFFSISNASNTVLDYDYNIANQSEEMSNNLLVAGAQLSNGDQVRFMEHGFSYNPDKLYFFTENMATGTVFPSTSVYNYVAIFTYRDGQDNLHRSGLSEQLSVNLSTGYANIDVLVPMLNITGKYTGSILVELYRTTNGGTVFYKVSDQDSTFLYKDYVTKEKAFILIRDVIPDTSLTDNEFLYTTGGILENTPIGSCSILESYKNRIFMGGVENDPNLLYYSKITTSKNVPVEFNDTLTVEVPKPGGDVVAIKKMDDKLIIFKKYAIYLLAGDGPNNLGEQNDFIQPQLVSSDLGCKFANSVVLMPQGLMFMSQKGIFLLSRSLGLKYIGAPAENYNHLTITKATTVAKKDEVRFLTIDGDTIIYNYFLDMWYTYSDHRGYSSHIVDDEYYLATYKNEVFKQVSTTSSFGGAMVPIKLTTGWLSFAGVQGYQRVYRMLLLGEYKSPHKLQIKIAYNYDDTWVEEKLIDVTGYTESFSYGNPSTGTDNTYGSPAGGGGGGGGGGAAITYGGKDNSQYQIRLNFQKQKCESIKIQIVEVEASNSVGNPESAGPGFNLSNLSFLVGVKDGDYKIKQSRTFGSTSIT